MATKLIFNLSRLPHGDPTPLRSTMTLFGCIQSYKDNRIAFSVGEGANVEVVKEKIASYCESRNCKVINIEEVNMSEKSYKVYFLIVEAGGDEEEAIIQSALGQDFVGSSPYTIETARSVMEEIDGAVDFPEGDAS